MNYITTSLGIAVFVLAGLLYWNNGKLSDARSALALAEQANAENIKVIKHLENSLELTDSILAAWDQDRTTLEQVRKETRRLIAEAMKDENFKAWANSAAHHDCLRLLQEATSTKQDSNSSTSSSTADRVHRDPGYGN